MPLTVAFRSEEAAALHYYYCAPTLQLLPRINTVMSYSNEAEASAELRKIESDLTQARQRVST